MTKNDNFRARELFFKYRGSFFHMSREGDYDEYRKFNISKKQEEAWKDELVKKYVGLLSMTDDLAVSNLSSIACEYVDYNILQEIIEYNLKHMDDGDSFFRIRYAEEITRIIRYFNDKDKYISLLIWVILREVRKKKNKCPKSLLIRAKEIVIVLLNGVLNNSIYVSPHWDIPIIDVMDENYIRERATEDLKEIEKIQIK